MARLDSAKADSARGNTVRAGCGDVNGAKIDGIGVNNARAGNRIRDNNGIKIEIGTGESKTSILVSSYFNICTVYIVYNVARKNK